MPALGAIAATDAIWSGLHDSLMKIPGFGHQVIVMMGTLWPYIAPEIHDVIGDEGIRSLENRALAGAKSGVMLAVGELPGAPVYRAVIEHVWPYIEAEAAKLTAQAMTAGGAASA